MRRWIRPVAAALTVLGALSTTGALADPVASVTNASWDGNRLNLNVLAKSVPLQTGAEAMSATVTVAGVSVPGNVSYVTSEVPDTGTAQSIMLVVDASGSMAGGRQRAAVRAVDDFLSQAPTNARIGLITFARKATLLSAPTTDRALLRALMSGIRPSGDTAMYDAVGLATRTLGEATPCTVLVLTDGKDTASSADRATTQGALTESPCTASFIGLQADRTTTGILEQLADAGRGRAYSADTADGISGVFVQSFTTTNASIAISAEFPADFEDRNNAISIDLGIADQHIGLTGSAVPVEEPGRSIAVTTTLIVTAAMLFIGVFGLIWLLSEGSDRARRRRIEALIVEYSMRRTPAAAEEEADSVLETLEDLLRPVLARTKRADRLANQLAGADLDMTAELWILLRLGVATVGGVALFVIGGSAIPAMLIGVPVGFQLPQMWLGWARRRRSKSFVDGLPDALLLMASSLRSGFSLDQAIVAASDQADSEVSKELRKAVQEIRIGSPLEGALDRIAERMDSDDFRWAVTALRIQRRSGGNLAELLTTVAATVRQRATLAREVRALSAEGRMSAYVLIALPLVLFAFLFITQPAYLEPLWATSTGLAILAVGGVMLSIGWLIMQKMIKVDV